MLKMGSFLHENHRDDPLDTMILLNVFNVLGVLNVQNALNMPKDAPLACWALFLLVVVASYI